MPPAEPFSIPACLRLMAKLEEREKAGNTGVLKLCFDEDTFPGPYLTIGDPDEAIIECFDGAHDATKVADAWNLYPAHLTAMRELCGVIAGCRDCDGIGVTYTIMSHTGGTTRVTSHCPHCTPLRAIVEKWYGEAVKLP